MAVFDTVNDYLDTVHHIDKTLIGDPTKVVVKSEYGFTMREIICNLLAGRGLKIPNIQVCVSVNLKAIAGYPDLPEDLKNAMDDLDRQFDAYLEHTSFNALMGRINKTVNEVSQVANMLNFCAAPIQPIEIPNVLENIMDSYLGAGKDLIDAVGTMLEPGGCLGFDGQEFNTTIFNEGILKDISDKWDRITSGEITQNEINVLVNSIESISASFEDQMNDENSTLALLSQGGSQFDNDTTSNNNDLGVMFDADSAGVQGTAQLASSLKSAYDQLGGYPVIGKDGTVYKNIFETFLEPGLIELLEKESDPTPTIANSVPVYDYCGNVIGFTQGVEQQDQQVSNGTIPTTPSNSPGFNGGGLTNSDPFNESGVTAGGTGSTTITNITQTGSGVVVASSESEMLSLDIPISTIVIRDDITSAYVKISVGTSISDFTLMNVPLSSFIQDLNSQGSNGIVIKSGNVSRVRSVIGQTNEIEVTHNDGTSGDIIVGISENPNIPGTGAIRVPLGTTAQRPLAVAGKIRYNTTLNRLEVYIGGTTNAWKSIAIGDAGVSDAQTLGSGESVYIQNNNGILEFKSLVAGNGISLASDGETITITDSLVGTSSGTGAEVYKNRTASELAFRTIVGGNNVTVTQGTDAISITGDSNTKYGEASTTNATPVEMLVSGSRIAPPSDATWFFSIVTVGRRTNGSGKIAIKREGIIDNSAGTLTLIDDGANSVIYANDVGNAWDFDVDVVGNVFRLMVTGAASSDINWKCKVSIVEV